MNLLFLLFLAHTFIVNEVGASIFGGDPWRWQWSSKPHQRDTNTHNFDYTLPSSSPPPKTEKKSLFEAIHVVDPKQIIRLICSYGGILLPRDVERDLKVLYSVCDCDEASLDLLNKTLILNNFTVSVPMPTSSMSVLSFRRDEHSNCALKVEKICIRWDSYLKPCIDIEVENADILIEFLNLIFTRNNWNELKDMGFPPDLFIVPDNNDSATSTSTSSKISVRIGSISTKGEVRLLLRSKPLNKDLMPVIVFNLALAQVINREIKRSSRRAEKDTGRRGCTTDEVARIIQSFFTLHVQELLREVHVLVATDVASAARTVNDAKKVLYEAKERARDAAVTYVKSVRNKTEEQLDEGLRQLGFGKENVDVAKEMLMKSAKSMFSTCTSKSEKRGWE